MCLNGQCHAQTRHMPYVVIRIRSGIHNSLQCAGVVCGRNRLMVVAFTINAPIFKTHQQCKITFGLDDLIVIR